MAPPLMVKPPVNVLAVVIGLVQGGVQSLSRAMYARLIPRDKAAELGVAILDEAQFQELLEKE